MKTVVEPLEGNKVKLSVEVDEQEMDKAVDAAIKRIAREVRIPGFRPGKAPRRVIEQRVGRTEVRQEALRDALPEFYAQAVRESEVDPIAAPEIDITGGEASGALQFDAVVEVRPNVSVPGYQGLQVTVPSPEVSDDDIDKQVDRLRANFGELEVVEREAGDGDFVTIDTTVAREGEIIHEAEDELYEVGSDSLAPGVDDHLRGAKAGDTVTFDTEAEHPLGFEIKVKEVKERILPELTDEWAAEASEFETVEELKADLRKRLEMVKKVQASMAIRDETVKALVELVEEEVPEALVAQEMERRLHDLAHRLEQQGASIQQYLEATGQPQQEFVDELRAASTQAVKADLALRSVAEAEGLEATEDDVEAEIAGLSARTGQSAAQIRRQLERADQMQAVRSDIKKAKALGWLVEHVEIVDEEGNPIDRAALQPEPADTETDPDSDDADDTVEAEANAEESA